LLLLDGLHLRLFELDPREPSCRHELDEDAVDQAGGADGGTVQILLHVEGHCAHVAASELNNDDLDGEGDDRDGNEHPVVEEACENVELTLAEFARVDLVEQLQEDERLEDDGVHEHLRRRLLLNPAHLKRTLWVLYDFLFRRVEGVTLQIRNAEDVATLEHEDKEDDDLVDSLHDDVAPHDSIDNHIVLVGRLAIKNAFVGRLGGKGQRCEGVHDEVDPKHLRRGERRLAKDARAREDDEHGNDVDCELELQELAHVVVDVATVLGSDKNGTEVVVEELNVARVFSHVSASNSHREADVGSVEGGRVVCAVASNSHCGSRPDQALDQHELVVGLRTRHNFELLGDRAELVHVLDFGLHLDFELGRVVVVV